MPDAIETGIHGPVWDVLIVLAGAGIVIPLFQRIRVSPVIGFMLVGLLVGPAGLGSLTAHTPWLEYVTITNRARIAPVAEFGVVLLLFMIGLELSFERIVALRRLVFGLGGLQVVLGTAFAGLAAAAAGLPLREAAVVGLALAMSSTAVVVQVLADERRVTGAVGRAAFAVLLFQDLSVVPVLFVIGVLGAGQGAGPAALLLAIGQAIGAVILLVLLGRLVLRRLFRGVARTQDPALFMAACLLVVLGTGVAALSAGLSMSLGALIAGLLLAETEFRRQIEVTVEPFKGLLLGVFLIAIGLDFDLALLLAHPIAVLGAALLLVAGKSAIVAVLARLFRLRWPVGAQAGLLLAPAGEFSFVILGLAGSLGLLAPDRTAFVDLLAALTMACIPLLSVLGRRLFPTRPAAVAPDLLPPTEPDADPAQGPRVVLAGFGRVGQVVAALLEAHGIPYIALDSDVARIARARKAGRPAYYGDVSNPALLRLAGLDVARALVVTVDQSRVDQVVRAARTIRTDLLIVARARDAAHAAALYRLGASDAVAETIEASLQLGEAVLVDLGIPMGPVIVSIHERRAAFQDEIKALVPEADIRPRGQVRLRAPPAPPPAPSPTPSPDPLDTAPPRPMVRPSTPGDPP